MKNRFFVKADLAENSVVALSDDERHHARVVRVRDGEAIEVFNGRGDSYDAVYEAGEVRLQKRTANREAEQAIALAMAIIQLEKFELVLQKATELGVASIIPMITERCEVRPERYRGKHERWAKIVFEAVKQSGRARIPKLEEPQEFENVIGRPGAKVVFDADTPPTADDRQPTTLLIGPEGGWSDDELRKAKDAGCAFRQLGPRRLRAETAAIVATAFAVR
jgi:16S rRNA (uracil1498-N3)-methyltransferase